MAEGIALAAAHLYQYSSPYNMPAPIEALKRNAQAVKRKIMKGKKQSEERNDLNTAAATDHGNIGTFNTSKIARLLESRKQKEAKIEAQRKQLALQQEVHDNKAACIAAEKALHDEKEKQAQQTAARSKEMEDVRSQATILAAEAKEADARTKRIGAEVKEKAQEERIAHDIAIRKLQNLSGESAQEAERKQAELEQKISDEQKMYQEEIDTLTKDKLASNKRESDANTRAEAAEARASNAELALGKLSAAFQNIKTQNENQREKLANIEPELQRAKNITTPLQKENIKLKGDVKKAQQTCQTQTCSLIQQVKDKSVEIEQLKAELDEANCQHKKIITKLDNAQKNEKKLGDELKEVQSALIVCQNEIAKYQNDSRIFDEHLTMLDNASAQQNARYEALKIEMAEVIAERDEEIERLESEASMEEVKMHQAEFEIEQLQERLRVQEAKHEQNLKDAQHADPSHEKLRKLQEENKANLSALIATTTGVSDGDTQQGLDNAFRAALSMNPGITPRGMSITQQNICGQEVYSDLSTKPCGRCTYKFYLHGALRIQRPNGLMSTDIGEAITFNNPFQKPEPSSLRDEVRVDEESSEQAQTGDAHQETLGEAVENEESTDDESSFDEDDIDICSSIKEDSPNSAVGGQARPDAPQPFIISDSDDEDSDEEEGSSTTEDSEAEDSNSSVTEYSHDFKSADSSHEEDKENGLFADDDDAEAGAVDYFDPNYDDPDFDWEVEHYDG